MIRRKYILLDCGEENPQRQMRIDINALCDIEDMLNKSVTDLSGEMGVREMRIVIFCALKWLDKKMTLGEAGEIMQEAIDANGMEYIAKKIGEALTHALGGNMATNEDTEEGK